MDLPAVTAQLLRQNAMDILSDGRVVITGYRGNRGSLCSFCNTVTSHCFGYMY